MSKTERMLAYLNIKIENANTSEERDAFENSRDWYLHVHELESIDTLKVQKKKHERGEIRLQMREESGNRDEVGA